MSKYDRQTMLKTSPLSGNSAEYVDQLYESYLADPTAIPASFRDYFSQLPQVSDKTELSHAAIREKFLELAKHRVTSQVSESSQQEIKQAHVTKLINAYRTHGHHEANLDPLGIAERLKIADLDMATFHLTQADLNQRFSTESPLSNNHATLNEILAALRSTYCGTLGIEFMHISNVKETQWLIQRLESAQGKPYFTTEQKREILQDLTEAEGLERYLGTRFVGQKRFSVEGGESLIPLLHEINHVAVESGVKEIIIGMAHRGRLNVLVNVLGKNTAELFEQFEGGVKTSRELTGDVKYHMGFASNVEINNKKLHLALAFNPSHLEIVTPVVPGAVRARQMRRNDLVNKDLVVPIVLHGDAAFAGQGVVMETFNFSQARGYSVGGTVHVVINNQIGFTTSNPLDARSTLYCTDIAKIVQAPVIHVNGDDPEMVVFAAKLAFDFRMTFKKDVVIDLVCYRRHGHNEADEPSITQPLMYDRIRQMPTTREIYAKRLMDEKIIKQTEVDAMIEHYRDRLDKGETIVQVTEDPAFNEFTVDWKQFRDKKWDQVFSTRFPLAKLKEIATKLDNLPKAFTPHPVIKRLWEQRGKMTKGEVALDWGYAETLAYATLLSEGYTIRLSGQDSTRGTFAHRNAVLHDRITGDVYVPLEQLATEKCQVSIIDSVLSEEAVLAFEYGYAASEPDTLVIWEAQFGDFANGAQVVIDQFISSGEQKWGRLSSLVMLLPHGMEGQGPEHSSARLERFLQLCAQHNMQVCVPTTPAQIYHLLRRQMIRQFRKPLIVMTPKSLLRHKLAVSTLEDLAEGEFQLIIPEIDDIKPKNVRRVILCCGKVYYDLLQQRRDNKQTDIAIIRVEQLYPFPENELRKELAKYADAKQIIWCQEEPKNQGAWYQSKHNIQECLAKGQTLHYVGRDSFAAPAVGHASLHQEQQEALVNQALSKSEVLEKIEE